MKKNEVKKQVIEAIHACQDKKAEEITVLQMDKDSGAFTDYFVMCSGSNPRQTQAISDEVELRLKRAGFYPHQIEGYKQAEWILIDYFDFVVHVFTEKARKFYDLERLWKSAKRVEASDFAQEEVKVKRATKGGLAKKKITAKKPAVARKRTNRKSAAD